jgi:hypothetical protein
MAVAVIRPLRRHPIRVACALGLFAAAGLASADPAWAKHQIDLSFVPSPARYSEIFFSNLAAVPSHLTAGVRVNVPFAIVNREGRTVTYTYSVVVTAPGFRNVPETRQVVIGNNQKAELIATFEPTRAKTLYEVRINLAKPIEFIEFRGLTS